MTYAGSKGNVGFARIAFVEEVKPFPFCHNDCFEVPNRSITREDEQQLWAGICRWSRSLKDTTRKCPRCQPIGNK